MPKTVSQKNAGAKYHLYVAPDGNDEWSGTRRRPNRAANDGPVASLAGARNRIRAFRRDGGYGPVEVIVAGGRYFLEEPVCFTPADSGPVTFRAAPGETPVFDAGTPVTGWQEATVNGVSAWTADVSAILQRQRPFHTIAVNGKPRSRTRLPKQGFYEADFPHGAREDADLFDGECGFYAKPGDFQPWKNLDQVEVVLLHLWAEDHLPVADFDPDSGRVTTTRRSIFTIKPGDSRYCIYNVFEAMTEPGEWYLDRVGARLYYIPLSGETPENTEIVAVTGLQFLRLLGRPENGEWVEHLSFDGLTFQNADWVFPSGWGRRYDPYQPADQWPKRDSFRQFLENNRLTGVQEYGNVPQGAHFVPGAVRLVGARHCTLANCTIRNAGFYAVEIAEGSRDVRITGNHLTELGAGGVLIDGGTYPSPESTYTGDIHVTDNRIHAIGRVFPSACGILLCHAFRCRLCHNEIHDTYYTGISLGWVWTREAHVSQENLVEKNHIYDIGQGMLSDMGGIYVLGLQPGTTLRGNLIHDVNSYTYGGWGIYPDGFASHLVIENNIVYNTRTESVHNNNGNSENLYRNNIFVFGRKGFCDLTRKNHDPTAGFPDRSMRCFGNIIVVRDAPLYNVQFLLQDGIPESQDVIDANYNLYWDTARKVPIAARENWTDDQQVDLKQWLAWGCDRNSVIADPGFKDPEHGDFSLSPDSPAFDIGFVPIDTSDVGPRSETPKP